MSEKDQERRRREGYRLLRAGRPQAQVARELGVTRQSVSRWAERMAQGGRKSWRTAGKRGPKPRLSATRLAELRRTLKAGAVAAGYPNELWTLPRVAEWIGKTWGIELGTTQVWNILRQKLGWSCQKPERRARERDEVKIRQWKRAVWPQLRDAAVAEKRLIVFVDESGLSQRPTRVRTWAPRGETPQITFNFNWQTLSAMAGVSCYQFYFKLIAGAVRAPNVVDFLKQLRERIPQPILVIWDGLGAHKSRIVRTYVDSTHGAIRLAYLPAYAPELNPVEYLWGHWKHHEIPNLCAASLGLLGQHARRALRRMQQRTSLIKAFWIQADLSL